MVLHVIVAVHSCYGSEQAQDKEVVNQVVPVNALEDASVKTIMSDYGQTVYVKANDDHRTETGKD